MVFKSTFKFICLKILFFLFFSSKINAGCVFSKQSSLRDFLHLRFSVKNTQLILKQHPKLTLNVAKDILDIVDKWETPFTDESELLSVFTLFATVRVGFVKLKYSRYIN